MKYQLILQWPASTIQDYDAMIELESAMLRALPEGSEVDGHDAGSGEVNIFINTNQPARVFNALRPMLASSGALATARVAFREETGSEYIVLWPEGSETFRVT